MRETGIIRKIDELGRIVIPKELRKTYKIDVGEPMQIYTGDGGEIIFKKYSPIEGYSAIAEYCAKSLSKSLNAPIVITDRERIVAVFGYPKSALEGKIISRHLETAMDRKKVFAIGEGEEGADISRESEQKARIIAPVIANSKAIGCVVALEVPGNSRPVDATEVKLCSFACTFLSESTEIK